MQTPDKTTPVSKCLELAPYATRMLGKFPGNVRLNSARAKLQASANALENAQNDYEAAVKSILPARVDVRYENYVSDRRIRLTQQKIEIADGRRRGPIAELVLPNGSAPIVRLVGASQVAAMIDLEGRLAASAVFYADAAAEQAAIEEHRQRYQAALDGRDNAGRLARNLRAVRDATRAQFVLDYAQVTTLVKTEFPRDRFMQDLFFDDVRSKSALAKADAADDDDQNGEHGEPSLPVSEVGADSPAA
jgi:hypothetical protein